MKHYHLPGNRLPILFLRIITTPAVPTVEQKFPPRIPHSALYPLRQNKYHKSEFESKPPAIVRGSQAKNTKQPWYFFT